MKPSLSVDVIKRAGKRPTEQFKREKLHASIVAVCLSTRTPEGQAEIIAKSVCDVVEEWLEKRQEITSQDLRLIASKSLRSYHPEAAYLYGQHRIIL